MTNLPEPARTAVADLVREGLGGVAGRPARAVLSALGIAIGVAAMVAVLGISASSQAELQARLDALGTNLLRVGAGNTLQGKPAKLPANASAMVGRIEAVHRAAAAGTIERVPVLRNDEVDSLATGGITVEAVEPDLLGTLEAVVRTGSWLNDATSRYPVVVLGSEAAKRLAIDAAGDQIYLGDRWFTVLAVLERAPLAPEFDRSAMVGWAAAQRYLGFDGHPTTVYERSDPSKVDEVRALLPATVNPERPEEVAVSRPSDALTAQLQAKATFTTMFLGLGAVALLTGGVGVANTMVISVLERRSEIGLRRALGARRSQVRAQFLAEAVLMSGLGGVGGVLLGLVASVGYAVSNGWPVTLPVEAITGGVASSVLVGVLAGWIPAGRAAALAPTVALAAT